MQIGICGYSFHRLMEAGQQDIFGYIQASRELGATQLDPWNAQLAPISAGDQVAHAGANPHAANLTAQDNAYLLEVRKAAEAAGLPFGCIAVDGAHIYEPTEEARAVNAQRADRWLEVAQILGARQVRIDAGGPEEGLPDDVLAIVVAGYDRLIAKAQPLGLEILIENHWGPSRHPELLLRILNAVKDLGLLFDTNNWAPGQAENGLRLCARHARSSHIKTFRFDAEGNDPTGYIPHAIATLREAGFDGCWGVESCPEELDEYEGAKTTIALIRRTLSA